MKKQELHCLVIRGHVGRYPALVQTLSKFSESITIELIDNDAVTVREALLDKKFSVVFLFKESGLSVDALADIMRKNGSESILVSLNDDKPQSTLSTKIGYSGVQICNFHYQPSGSTSRLALKFLLQYAFLKTEFRNCKSLLRVSEQRCHWLVDSSSEAVAYIGSDLHLYANQTYINLLAYDSLHSLKIIAVSDLILEDERQVYFDFMHQYENRAAKASALIVTLQPQTGEGFRASIRLIPTVFSGTRCYQLWIRKLGSGRLPPLLNEARLGDASSSLILEEMNDLVDDQLVFPAQPPQNSDKSVVPTIENSVVTEENMKSKVAKEKAAQHAARFSAATRSISTRANQNGIDKHNKPAIYTKLLKQILLSNDVSLKLSKLDRLHQANISTRQYIVDLDVEEREYNNVSGVLAKKYQDVFWDHAMIMLLFKRLKQAGSNGMRLLIPLTEASLSDEGFKQWLSTNISHFEGDTSSCVFLLPLFSNEAKQGVIIDDLQQYLVKHPCRIGIDGFELSQQTKTVLRETKAEFVRFSKKWVIANIKNKAQAIKLANTIKVLEKNNIKVIAPYNSGEKMKQLFDMAGASFCQKQAVS
ncbi:MAG: EAL domain-containing protein [Cocleimonas sp.]|nr:EAL domain-containing protein [Cocleimonas sp.]